MSRILMIHASSYGQTLRIAGALAARLRERGHIVEQADAAAGARGLPPPDDYDAVVLGSRVQFGRHARAIRDYLRANRAALEARPSAFFSVSMAASDPKNGTDPNGYLHKLFAECAWEPQHAIAFAGGLPYRRYGWLLRFVMKRISRAAGHSTDTSQDHELTDWTAVTRFADELADALRPAAPAPTTTPSGPTRERARA